MKPPRIAIPLGFTFALALAAAPRSAFAADPDAEQRAGELENEARAAVRAGKLEEAASSLRAAWDLARWSSIACNLGRVEFARRRFRDAAEFLSLCVESAPPVRTPEEKKRFASAVEQLAEARANVITLLLSVNEPEASILLDGQRAAAPPLPRALFAEPGRHRVAATLDGFSPASAEIQGSAGETIEVDLTLRPAPAPPPPPLTPPSTPSVPPPPLRPVSDASRLPPSLPPEPPKSKTLATALGIGAGVSAGVSVASWIFAESAYATMLRESEAYQRDHIPCTPIGCGAPEASDTYERAKNTWISTLVLGGVLGAAACVTGLCTSASAKRSAQALPTVIAW